MPTQTKILVTRLCMPLILLRCLKRMAGEGEEEEEEEGNKEGDDEDCLEELYK